MAQNRQATKYPLLPTLLERTEAARRQDSLSALLNLPSERKAASWSMATTLIPIAAGVVIWKCQKRAHIVEYNSHGLLTRDFYQDPDRTLPAVIIASGVIFGPSAGYFYGGCGGRGLGGILFRVGTGAATLIAARAAARASASDEFFDYSEIYAGLTVGAIGAGIIVFHAMYDLTNVKKVVRKHNEKALGCAINISPKIFAHSNVLGLELTAIF
jgi:hypothetical protein